MIKTISFRGLLGLTIAALLSPTVLADTALTQAEANSIIKEDIASIQVMAEMCPALLGKSAKFDQNIQKLIQASLQEYSDKSMSYAKLQADTEYNSALNESRTDAKSTAKDEQKAVCTDVLDYEG